MITIDTIRFTLPYMPEAKANRNWVSLENKESGLCSKETWKSEDNNFHIIRDFKLDNTTVSLSSATRYLYGHAFMRGIESMSLLTDKVQYEIDKVLRNANIMDANVSRLDNSTVYEVQAPVFNYTVALGQVLPQCKGHYNKQVNKTSVKLYTGSSSLIMYDKIAKHEHEAIEQGIQGNLLRYELKMGNKAIVRHLGSNRLRDLMDHERLLSDNLQKHREYEYNRLIKPHTSSERHLSTLKAISPKQIHFNRLFDAGVSPEILEHDYDQMKLSDRSKRRYKKEMREAYAKHQNASQINLFNEIEKNVCTMPKEHHLSKNLRVAG